MKETAWFESWFDSPYYHLLYKDRDNSEAQNFLDLLLERIHLKSGSPVLDLACGKGRHSLHLFQNGYDVTGIDLSEENIRYCHRFENERLHFYRHDMRRILRLNYFDAVFNLFTSFGYFDRDHENELVVQAASSSLHPGGYFIIDFLNAHYTLQHLCAEQEKNIEGITFHLHRKTEGDHLIKEIRFHAEGRDFRFREKVKLLFPEDFMRYFAKSGLTVLETYGNYQLQDFNAESSQRLIFVTRKL
ncbi:MAG: methyltransferase domain-containing protein [Bacteroidia bacterium]|nr:methyltransferase domain-containing protein [Bacteroidia bacterium]